MQVFISGSETFEFSLLKTYLHPTAPAKVLQEIDTAG